MTNEALAAKLAKQLQDGFTHPGDPKRNLKPRPILLPFKSRPGMPEEMTNLLTETAKLLSECIVASIEQDYDLVPPQEAKAMRRAVGQGPPNPIATPVYCRCNTDTPLMYLTISDPDAIVVHAPALIKAMHERDIKCPHDKVDR